MATYWPRVTWTLKTALLDLVHQQATMGAQVANWLHVKVLSMAMVKLVAWVHLGTVVDLFVVFGQMAKMLPPKSVLMVRVHPGIVVDLFLVFGQMAKMLPPKSVLMGRSMLWVGQFGRYLGP